MKISLTPRVLDTCLDGKEERGNVQCLNVCCVGTRSSDIARQTKIGKTKMFVLSD